MFDEIKKYKNNGHFFFKKGDNLKHVSSGVSDLPGVYYMYVYPMEESNLFTLASMVQYNKMDNLEMKDYMTG